MTTVHRCEMWSKHSKYTNFAKTTLQVIEIKVKQLQSQQSLLHSGFFTLQTTYMPQHGTFQILRFAKMH